MKKKLMRDVRPDIFKLVKDKDLHYDIGVGCFENIEFICPRCGAIVTQMVTNVIRRGLSCKRCGDGISFGEKFVFNVLDQLHIDFKTHVTFPWSNNRVYDVVTCLGDESCIIEIHGKQHYLGGFESYGGRTLQEEIDNDKNKMQLAITNGFVADRYIIIDCRISSVEYIKNSIVGNAFFQKYDLSVVKWDECAKNAMSSYAIRAQHMWDNGSKIEEIALTLKIERHTVQKYLKQGADIGMCTYSVTESYHRRRSNTFIPTPPKMVFSPELRKIFYSLSDAHRHTNISSSSISICLSGRYKSAGKLSDGTRITWFETSLEDALLLVSENNYKIIGDKPNYVF